MQVVLFTKYIFSHVYKGGGFIEWGYANNEEEAIVFTSSFFYFYIRTFI